MRPIEDSRATRSPNAYAKVIDRLLVSPEYGKRWGRHWLDVVRYSDTAGDNSDYPIPQMVLYRDWVIDAFNRDMPYELIDTGSSNNWDSHSDMAAHEPLAPRMHRPRAPHLPPRRPRLSTHGRLWRRCRGYPGLTAFSRIIRTSHQSGAQATGEQQFSTGPSHCWYNESLLLARHQMEGPVVMRDEVASWVVYLMTVRNKPDGMRAVCEQSEWDKMELDRPGYHLLIQDGIATENEAEKLARGDQGNAGSGPRLKARWARNAKQA